MNSSSERKLTELRIARAFVQLSSILEDGSTASVSLARNGNCEIRMFRGPETDFDRGALFWLELFDHATRMSIDSFACNKIEEAAPVFEHLMSQSVDLNDPDPNRGGSAITN